MFIIDNQLILLLLFFLIGSIGTVFLLRRPASHRAWRFADLIWVLLGGFGALGAVLAGIYTSDSSRIERQIDVAYAASAAFDRDAARFRLSYCESGSGMQVARLCDKVDFLSASTAENADLPLFISITMEVSPLQSLRFFGSADENTEMASKREMADQFDPGQFLVFAARDETTEAALAALRQRLPEVAADFIILADSYEALITQVRKLKTEWEFLQRNVFILLIQIISLCLVSFAAPFRLGKSIVEIRDK